MYNHKMAISSKESFANDIGSFILSSEATVKSIISDLGWSIDHMWTKDDSYEVCPLDSAHSVPAKSLRRHVELCSCLKDGYSKEEMACLPPDPKFAYEGRNNVVTIPFDEEVQETVLRSVARTNGQEQVTNMNRKVPKTMARATCEFTREERLAFYDHAVTQSRMVIKNAGIRIEEMNLNFDPKEDTKKPKSFLQVLAEQRDYKRRRQSYRAKNVHITKKSYTEVMREVIQKQMEYLDPEMKEGSDESRNESFDARNSKDPDSLREFGRTNDEREDSSRRRRSRSRERWRESNRMRENHKERSHNRVESSRETTRPHKKHRSRTPQRKILSPPKQKGRRSESGSPRHRSDDRSSSRHKKKHKHRHHKRSNLKRHRE